MSSREQDLSSELSMCNLYIVSKGAYQLHSIQIPHP